MAKFINKKHQVMDLKLTSYGHYLFSIGRFTPTYYAFFDDNVLYDASYGGRNEVQNSIHPRIKDETPYLEGLTLFENIDKNLQLPSDINRKTFYAGDITSMMELSRKDSFKLTDMIGDAYLDGPSNAAPAWKVVVLDGQISSSMTEDTAKDLKIPQINVDLNYTKRIVNAAAPGASADSEFSRARLNPKTPRQVLDRVGKFSDGKYIELVADNALIYMDEANTEVLTENFDIEVFEVLTNPVATEYKRKYFSNIEPQIINGMMMKAAPSSFAQGAPNTASVAYYFDILADYAIDNELACKAMEEFNKKSYYIDLDFDCETVSGETILMDIYGKVTEPDICP
jgi:hypothetical protein